MLKGKVFDENFLMSLATIAALCTNNIEEAVTLGDRIILLSSCPAEVKQIYVPNLPRPRDNMSPEFLAFREMIEKNTDMAL